MRPETPRRSGRTAAALTAALLAPVGPAVLPAAAQERPLERLQAEDRAAGDLFGCALDLAAGTLLVGSLLDDDLGADSGSAYVFETGGPGGEAPAAAFRQTAKLLAPDGAAGDELGFAVALDREGAAALLGAPLSGPGGAVYRFGRDQAGRWRFQGRLGTDEAGAGLGTSVAFDGRRAVAGAPTAASGGRAEAGAVLVFGPQGELRQRLSAASPGAGDGFGWSLAPGDRLLAVGAPWADTPFTDTGSVHLFRSSEGGFVPAGTLTAPDGRPFDAFGYALARDGDVLAVGAPRADGSRGAVYVFREGPEGFALETRLVGTAPGEQLGTSVAVEGRTLAAGARLADGVGAVQIFRRSADDGGDGGWEAAERIQPPEARTGDEVGIAVALSGGGIAVGAYRDDAGGADAGSVYARLPVADLALTKERLVPPPGSPPAPPGAPVQFRVEVTNEGPDGVAGVPVRDPVPAGLAGVTWGCEARGSALCTPTGTGSIDDRVDLPPGSGVVYLVDGQVAQTAAPGATVVNRASVEVPAGVVDPAPGNEADQAALTVGAPSADLFVDVRSLAEGPVSPAGPIVHEVEIGNLGPSDAPPLTFAGGGLGPAFSDPTWTCAAEGGASCVPAAGTGAISGTVTLPAGSRVVYTLSATVSSTAGSTLVLTVSLGPLAPLDPNPANNSDTATTPVAAAGPASSPSLGTKPAHFPSGDGDGP